MTRKQTPSPAVVRPWLVVDLTDAEQPIEACVFKPNAQFVCDVLNRAEPGRYRVVAVNKLSEVAK